MVPAITAGGRSFKGAAQYYLHDKGAETTNRVAWAETVNLPTADPARAWRMMAYTAMAQADLKEAAGVKAAGRKLEKPVFAYSLSWHPDEQPTKEHQLEAARETLKVLGLEDFQALIVCHDDEPHPHVHILVNRVSPQDGRAATLSNSKRKLSDWALKYEKERGKILCPQREENARKRARGQDTEHPRKPRSQYEAEQRADLDNLTAVFIRTEQKQKDAALYRRGRAMHDRHRKQWLDLKEIYQAAKRQLKQHHEANAESSAAKTKGHFRPKWAELFRRQEKERADLEAVMRRPISRLAYFLKNRDLDRFAPEHRGMLSRAFHALTDPASRKAAFEALKIRHEIERTDLGREQRSVRFAATEPHKVAAEVYLIHGRNQYMGDCDKLRSQQQDEKTELQAAWRERNEERRSAFLSLAESDEQETIDTSAQRAQEQGLTLDLSRHLSRGPRRDGPG